MYLNEPRPPNTHTPFPTEKVHTKRIVYILRPAVVLPRFLAGYNIIQQLYGKSCNIKKFHLVIVLK